MEKDNLIKVQKFSFGMPDLFMLPATSRLKGYDKSKHERAGADLFVSFYPLVSHWQFEPPIGKERGDRGVVIDGKQIFIEVDRCTEGMKVIQKKVQTYIDYASRTGNRFHVVFSLLGTENQVANRGEALTAFFASQKRGNQFLACNHENLINHPLGEILYSPLEGAVSISRL